MLGVRSVTTEVILPQAAETLQQFGNFVGQRVLQRYLVADVYPDKIVFRGGDQDRVDSVFHRDQGACRRRVASHSTLTTFKLLVLTPVRTYATRAHQASSSSPRDTTSFCCLPLPYRYLCAPQLASLLTSSYLYSRELDVKAQD